RTSLVEGGGDTVDRPGGRHGADPRVCLGHGVAVERLASLGCDHGDDGEIVGAGELEVTLIVGGDRHDRPGAIPAEHVVGDPDRHVGAVDRVDGETAGEHPG